MKTEDILEYLRTRKDISEWTYETSREAGREAFFTGRRLDLNRAADVVRGTLTVHADLVRNGTRGSATLAVPPSAGRGELAALADAALERARVSAGPAWRLPEARNAPPASAPAAGRPSLFPAEALRRAEEAVFSAETAVAEAAVAEAAAAGAARFAAVELFARRRERTFAASTGAAASWEDLALEAELTALAGSGDDEVELMEGWTWALPPSEDGNAWESDLAATAELLLRNTLDRAAALPLSVPQGTPVVLRGAAVEEYFGHFFFRTAADQVRSGASDSGIGAGVLRQALGGDPLTLGFDPALPGSPLNRPVDADGCPLARTTLVRSGRVLALAGPARHAAALSIPAVGACASRWVAPGSLGDGELFGMPRLEALVFSDFFMDEASGEFGGELRLAAYWDGKKRTPMTGGSLSGSISEEAGTLRFTSAVSRRGGFSGPAGVLVRQPRISAGA